MTLDDLTFYPPTWRGRPPALQRNDWPIWLSFLDDQGASFDGFAYDVELHSSAPPPENATPDDLALWKRLTAKRIDALARKGSTLTMIEIRPRLSFQTIGQLLGYQALFPVTFPDAPAPALLIVAAVSDPDMDAVAAAQRIPVLIYPQPRLGALASP